MSVLRLSALLLAVACAAVAQESAPASRPASRPFLGKTFFWFRMWPDVVAKFDPVTDTVVKQVKCRNGVGYNFTLAHDRRRAFIVTDRQATIEVIDLERGEVVEEHSFRRDGFVIRIDQVRECPGGAEIYVRLDKIKAQKDRYDLKESEWVLYDLKAKKSGKPMKEMPDAIRRGARISPDGRKWHVFGRDLVIVDPKTLKEEGKIEISRPAYGGVGGISLRGDDFFDLKNPDAYRMLYTMKDPVMTNRVLWGIADIDLKNLKVGELREFGADPRAGEVKLTRDKKRAIVMRWGRWGGRGDGEDPEVTLATYDLTNGRKLFEGRAKVREAVFLSAIAPDGSKSYLSGRGHEFVVLDDKHQYLKTIELPGEIDAPIYVVEE